LRKKDRIIDRPGNSIKRRDRLGIIAEILEIAKDGTFKTPIMYKANLSFAQLNEYLSFLLEKKLVKVVVKNKGTIYETTPKGLKYLQSYGQIKDILRKKEERNVKNAKSSSDCKTYG
jgi:predicted transcriptional regulator